MAAERTATGRPRTFLIVLLAVAILAFFVLQTDTPVGPGRPVSGTGAATRPGDDVAIDPAALDVHLDSLAQERPAPAATSRDPFRFETRQAGPPAEGFRPPVPELGARGNGMPPSMAVPARPIAVRFIGVLEHRGETFAIFSDCTAGRSTSYARAGEIVDGRYRLIRIGMESVVVEHLDGTGRTTLAQTGQECVRP